MVMFSLTQDCGHVEILGKNIQRVDVFFFFLYCIIQVDQTGCWNISITYRSFLEIKKNECQKLYVPRSGMFSSTNSHFFNYEVVKQHFLITGNLPLI